MLIPVGLIGKLDVPKVGLSGFTTRKFHICNHLGRYSLKSKLILEIFVKFKTIAREKKQAAVTAEDSGETATACRGKATRPVGASLALRKSDVLHIAKDQKTLFEKFNILTRT